MTMRSRGCKPHGLSKHDQDSQLTTCIVGLILVCRDLFLSDVVANNELLYRSSKSLSQTMVAA